MTIAEALHWGRERLGERLEAELLLAHVLQSSRTALRTWPERELSARQAQAYQEQVERRCEGWPIAYLTGEREFWSLPLKVTPDTLIPRPETEHLVELALARLPAHTAATVLDLGTGSGALALAIAHERPGAQVTAVDRSTAALAVAHENAQRHGLERVELLQSDWYSGLSGRRFALIVANPPYIGHDEPEPNAGDARFEPRTALLAAKTGLADLETVIAGAPGHLEPGGWLLVEHGYRQGEAVRRLFEASGFHAVETVRDLAGHERASLGQAHQEAQP